MRKLSFTLTVALIALVLGFFVFAVTRTPQTMAYCHVARNAEEYHNKIIRVRVTLLMSSDATYIYEDCDPVEALASLVEIDSSSDSDTRGYVEQLLVQRDSSSLKKADAVIEGRFDAEFSRGCWGPKFHIAANKVELLTPLSDYVPPQVDEEGMRTKH